MREVVLAETFNTILNLTECYLNCSHKNILSMADDLLFWKLSIFVDFIFTFYRST